ncbi:aminotransferase class V-fold PLP-dependent enzyme [Amycolatopsis acidiphila]|uniref:Aminotransferase class V-fold PLP-dependent enzyme n=1 Tax=Amycolatopsis acidiphila TaxID=715473 RepID=A0A557ZS56_9PSEU|nr:aminotransferase class V-fold PLP-dependent enzyme [Amycolatopsis acidiphila]TVT14822.1 aminotransferase class V-fold PLP-dependent enzyme [Amycolatopsis acidiphila]UIJ62081.1 aminotransferase class V-fold PLP-dependent enzyme [Amycolatopsis acidiphila]GHG91776.1 aminotransferase class V [Amycolatopsis acidiphila]
MRTAFGTEFDIRDGYLNTPAIGVPPVQAADEVAATVGRWGRAEVLPSDFEEAVTVSRQGFADLIGVPADRVAIGAAVSQLLGAVAAGLPEGAKVLVAAGEFTSVTFPFAARPGVTVTEVPPAELPDAVAGHDLVAVSVVQSADGAVLDLDALRAASEAANVPVVLDATQAAGWLPLRLDWADWVVAAGYKWLLAPRGTAWLAVHPRALERGVPVGAGWYAGEDPWQSLYGLPLRLAAGTRRYDLSPVWFAQVGAAAVLPYLASLDLSAVQAHCVKLAGALRAGLGLPEGNSAIVSFDADADRLRQAGVVASARAGKARVGFHLYNTEADVERVLHAVGR